MLSLHLHPLKSSAVRDVGSARVEAAGLVGDRRWMAVDAAGAMLTARTERRLLTITADTAETDPSVTGLRLRADGLDDLALVEPVGPEQPLTVFGDRTVGVDAGDRAARWLGRALRREDVRLVHASRPAARSLDPRHSRPGDHTGFADGFPLLLTTTASLQRLDELVVAEALARGEEPGAPLPMHRFRPNLVVDGTDPFAEDGWSRLRVGSVVLRVAKPCGRCVMTTVDPATLASGREPLRTLARHRRRGTQLVFGQNLVPETTGELRVGDAVELLG
nr:MOSC N-terminal beta barrel domain-containing protein [Auraticoccus cholistanensis]